ADQPVVRRRTDRRLSLWTRRRPLVLPAMRRGSRRSCSFSVTCRITAGLQSPGTMPRTMKRPVGAPSTIDDIVAHTPEGIPVTASERLCEVLRTGDFVHAACEAAHIDQSTYYGWLAKGADAARKRAAGDRLTANDRRYMEFVTMAREAEIEGRRRILGAIQAHATTGAVVVTLTKKLDGRGKVIERTIREEHRPSDPASAQWIAERRWPKDSNRRQQL